MSQNDDLIRRQMAIDALDVLCQEHRYRIPGKRETYSQYNEAWQDALDRAEVAIGNLPSAQPATNCSEIPNGSDDTISRQVAIDALARMMPRSYTPDGSHPADEEIFRVQEVFADCIEALEILPSAQPEILACGEGELNVPDTNVGDMISRQAAIDALDVLCQEHRYKIPGKRETYSQYNEAWQDALDRAEGAIFNLPTVQPDHTADVSKKAEGDCISRQAALKELTAYIHLIDKILGKGFLTDDDCTEAAKSVLGEDELPAAQPERDIPVKPNETTDTTWGVPRRQAVCPKCDYYLGHVAFLGDYKGKKVTYCDTCGQAIDWEGWDSDG